MLSYIRAWSSPSPSLRIRIHLSSTGIPPYLVCASRLADRDTRVLGEDDLATEAGSGAPQAPPQLVLL